MSQLVPLTEQEVRKRLDLIFAPALGAPRRSKVSPGEQAAKTERLRTRLDDLLLRLTRREGVVRLRYGADAGRVLTFEEVGRELQENQAHTRELLATALGRLRPHSREQCP